MVGSLAILTAQPQRQKIPRPVSTSQRAALQADDPQLDHVSNPAVIAPPGRLPACLRPPLQPKLGGPTALRVRVSFPGSATSCHTWSLTCLSLLSRPKHPRDRAHRCQRGTPHPFHCQTQFTGQKSFQVGPPNPHTERPRESNRAEARRTELLKPDRLPGGAGGRKNLPLNSRLLHQPSRGSSED